MTSEPSRKRRRWQSFVIVLLAGAAALVVGILFLHISSNSSMERLRKKARDAGDPVTLQDLADRLGDIPEQENGAVALLNIWERNDPAFWKAFRSGENPLPEQARMKVDPLVPFLPGGADAFSRTSRLSPEMISASEKYLESQKERMGAVRKALEYQRFRFPVQITNGFAALIPHVPQMKSEMQHFRIEACLACDRGDIPRAIDAMQTMADVARPLAQEPFLISSLVRMSCYNSVLDEMERILSRHLLRAADLDRLVKLADELQMTNALRQALISERAASLDLFHRPEALTRIVSDERPSAGKTYMMAVKTFGFTGLKNIDEFYMLETMDRAIALAERTDPDALFDLEHLFKDASESATRFPPHVFSAYLVGGLSALPGRFAGLEARRRAALVAIAIERCASHDGRLPERLEQLTPEFLAQVPRDPFENEPLRFRLRSPGYVVYAIGMDAIDNDGAEKPKRGPVDEFDHTFVVER